MVVGMRIAVLTVLVLLAAGCSLTTNGKPHPVPDALPTTTPSAPPTTATAAPPERGAPFDDVAAWVRAGTPADPARYATATTDDGVATPLNGDIAFTSPTGKIKCISAFQDGLDGLSCLVELRNPPERPAGSPNGNWVPNWIDYSGGALTVGSLHGDPGAFVRGFGAVLPYGNRVSVKDFTCRVDTAGLFCVRTSTKSGVRISDAGVLPFGCLREQGPDAKQAVGQAFRC